MREDEKYLYKFFRQQQQLESSAKTKKEKVKKEKEMDSLDDIDVLLGKGACLNWQFSILSHASHAALVFMSHASHVISSVDVFDHMQVT